MHEINGKQLRSRFDEEHDRKTIWIALVILLILVGTGYGIHALGQKGIPPLTNDERLSLRNLEVTATNAENELHKTKEYQAFMSAQQDLQAAATAVFTKRKLSMTDYTICDGDAVQPVCAGVGKNTLELRPIPKAKASSK